MKKIICLFFITFSGTLSAQMVSETVTIHPGYTHQTWYELETGTQVQAPKDNWDIAFATSAIGMGSSIRVNAITGTRLWVYPNGDTSAWNVLDTAGITGWKESYNSDTSWLGGAFDANLTSNEFDLGWGIYNSMTHIVGGDSLFVIKLSDGSYRKVWIENLVSGIYNFRFANIDGTSPVSKTITKLDYPGKNFAYYSLRTNTEFNPEPLNSNWDLLFTQYTTTLPGFGPYGVSGVLQNHGTKAVKVYPVDDPETYEDFAGQSFSSQYNILGYDWKTYSGGAYVMADSTVYFVKTKAGDIWKIIFTGFGGSANGNFMFNKEKISSVGINETGTPETFLSVYPNPCNTGNVILVTNAMGNNLVTIYNTFGQQVLSKSFTGTGLVQHQLSVNHLQPGTYLVRINNQKGSSITKLVIR